MKLLPLLLVVLFQVPAPGPVPSPGQAPGPVPSPRGTVGGAPVPLRLGLGDPAPVGPVMGGYSFDCLATGPAPGPIVMKAYWNEFPFDSLKLLFEQLKPESTDKTAPVITGVVVGLVNVLGNAGKIAAASNGAPFNISAGDDLAVTHASLFVDGIQTTTAADPAGLPALFYMRWNGRAVATGQHAFRLVVWDAAGNPAEKNWVMFR